MIPKLNVQSGIDIHQLQAEYKQNIKCITIVDTNTTRSYLHPEAHSQFDILASSTESKRHVSITLEDGTVISE